MEPIPETVEAVAELDAYLDDGRLLERLMDSGDHVRDIVPDCVGLSVAYLDEGIVFTLVATSLEIALFDALQYLEGGPCVDAVAGEQVVEVNEIDALDEPGWRLFSEATAAAGIRSTLTLPILVRERVTGSVNLYASSARAFTGHHQQLADALGAWAPGAVTNSDLSFTTRTAAQRTPQLLRERMVVDMVVGHLMATQGLTVDESRRRLEEAASRAGVSIFELAQAVAALRGRQDR